LANCWFWLAQYGPVAVVPPNWPTWTMWQYTDGAAGPGPHEVDGIGHCDRNRFQGDEEHLHKLWGV
jgi:lysozyme